VPDIYELEEIEQPVIPSVTMPSGIVDTEQDVHVLPTPGPQGPAGTVGTVNMVLWYENAKV
jgi:hypothetical protein